MAREKKGKLKISDGPQGPLSVSIGAMLGRGDGSAGPEEREAAAPAEAKAPAGAADVAAYLGSLQRAVLHRESSGRGGRTVTVVSCKPSPSASLAGALAQAMRKGLGCGSRVEGGAEEKIVLQGDIGDRAEAWLTKQGVGRIVRGN